MTKGRAMPLQARAVVNGAGQAVSAVPASVAIAEIDALALMTDDEIDTSDIPEQVDFSNARIGRYSPGLTPIPLDRE